MSAHKIDPKMPIRFMEREYIDILFFRSSVWKYILYCLSFALFPIVPVIYLWFPYIRTKASKIPETDALQASHVLVKDYNKKWVDCKVTDKLIEGNLYRTFEFRKHIYILLPETGEFCRLDSRLVNLPPQFILEYSPGFSSFKSDLLLKQTGLNTIDIEPEPISKLLLTKLFHPFYLFQIASVIIWFIQEYTTYALLIVVLSTTSLCYEIYSVKMDEIRLQKLVKVHQTVTVVRDGIPVVVDAKSLVTGDTVIVQKGESVVCDIVVVDGECVVDESALTGETVPIVKTPLQATGKENEMYSPDTHKSCTLYSGSKVTDIRMSKGKERCLGVVTATGFYTTKGELFRSILYPHEIDLKFNRQSYIYLAVMGCIAVSVFLYRLGIELRQGGKFSDVVLNSLDLITITVPPALPLVLSLGIGYALNRLNRKRIYCINPQRINFAGWTTLVCLDKTGTLTEDKLEFKGIDRYLNGQFMGINDTISSSLAADMCILTCHSVNKVGNEYVGQFVDQEMFKATKWEMNQECHLITVQSVSLPVVATIEHPYQANAENKFHILKRNDFDARIQLASVICAVSDKKNDYNLFSTVKGSPEAIMNVCRPESLPKNFLTVARRHSQQGYYVLALASKFLDIKVASAKELAKIPRNFLESDLEFAGFILFDSRLKPESKPMLDTLNRARIKSIIITGDNAFTSIHAARELGMVKDVLFVDTDKNGNVFFTELCSNHISVIDELPHRSLDELSSFWSERKGLSLAVNGTALRRIKLTSEQEFYDWLLTNTVIFSRAKPQQKTEIVEDLILLGNFTVMCGDGTNDCGALKAAHVGLALSDTEASIVAPFSSASKTVADIPVLLSEGRCALETSFTAFKYMAVYPIVQLTYAMVAHQYESLPGNNMYMFDDIGIVLLLAQFMLLTKPALNLSSIRPWSSLFSLPILSSIIGLSVICISFTIVTIIYLASRPWYCDSFKAQSGLDLDFKPVNPSAPFNVTYPCYYIDPVRDIQFGTLISSYETTFTWLFSHFQFITVSLALSLSVQFRRPIWTNRLLILWLVLSFAGCTFLLLADHETSFYDGFRNILQLRDDGVVPFSFRLVILAIVGANACCLVLWESVFVPFASSVWYRLKNRVLVKQMNVPSYSASSSSVTVY